MKKLIVTLIVILVIGLSIYTVNDFNKNKLEVVTKGNTTSPNVSLNTEKAPLTKSNTDNSKTAALDFKLTDLNGKEVSLSDFKGKKVFINFWTTWCGYCKDEMPDIQKLYTQTKDSDLVILAINCGESKNTVKNFSDTNKYTFTILLDNDENVRIKYNVHGFPTSYFIDKEGNVVSTVSGAISLEEMKNYISKL